MSRREPSGAKTRKGTRRERTKVALPFRFSFSSFSRFRSKGFPLAGHFASSLFRELNRPRLEEERTELAEQRLKLGFVGCGTMVQWAHLENYARLPNVELVALAEGRPRLAGLVAEKYGFRRTYPNHEALLQDPEVEAV